jgi:hypothetical protein
VTLKATFQTLDSRIMDLTKHLKDTRLVLVEDKPLEGDKHLIGQLSDLIYAVRDPLEEALRFIRIAEQAATPLLLDLESSRTNLGACHEQVNGALNGYFELVSYDRIGDLVSMGEEFDKEGREWAESVKCMLEECQGFIAGVNQSLLASWQDLSELNVASAV